MRWRELLQLNEQNPLPADFFKSPRRVHFIGVGGIGMSALALLVKSRGHDVSGSDASESAMLSQLRESGITCFVGQKAENIEGAEAIFYSSAIAPDNAEFAAATKNQPKWHRSQLLAHFVNNAKTSIAVSGTHGKSTTSAMIAHILTECSQNPTAVLGAIYPPFNSNLRVGNPDLIVVEADESDGSFTLLKPTIAVVLNVEPEHLENYDESEEELWKAFEMFVEQSKYSLLNEDEGAMPVGLLMCLQDSISDVHGYEEEEASLLKIGVPGRHNVSNAAGALAACFIATNQSKLGPEVLKYKLSLATFAGTLRRFERKGEAQNIVVYDDYGHHPTEVRATLDAAKEFLNRPIAVVFQPHRYSRTLALHRDFGSAFQSADKIIITQLYSAYEPPIEGVSGRMVFDAVRENFPEKSVYYAEDLMEAKKIALETLQSGDALLTMGAGDITKLGPQILEALGSRH
ncbi:UDP-N-acetylmuramate--L-alanine ligase [Abditibacterium utsteinense]|uniref:UDP-N-acetylmuramate--L-alanine ligase n=1 Tax=Abditibacterium utsteinense TaxID=1960156 RepID=A0A2S8SSL3_9BACT|nr:UDP-N-acetylmuramate--L-alanine ligase [Abditibacterium utsteinense]PQV63777.1 UDP-N-acetylmuramate--L-alanine ligase [Abditibacterium utsteinense]